MKTVGEVCYFNNPGVAGYGIIMEHGNDAFHKSCQGRSRWRTSLQKVLDNEAIKDLLTLNCKAPSL